MARHPLEYERVVMDVPCDSEDNGPVHYGFARFGAPWANVDVRELEPQLPTATTDEFLHLQAIPDIDVPPSECDREDHGTSERDVQNDSSQGHGKLFTKESCLQMVLSVLPDISTEFVLTTIDESTTDTTRTLTQCEQLIAKFLDEGNYRKEADEAKGRKRKWEAEDSLSDYEKDDRGPDLYEYEKEALELLKDEFLDVPIRHITITFNQKKTLFKAFGALEEQLRTYKQVATPFAKIGKARIKRGMELQLIERGSQLPKELNAAKKRIEIAEVKRQRAAEIEEAEEQNLQQAQATNQMGECACCFEDVPLNRMISCSGDTMHLYCKNCPRKQIETLMGQSQCRPTCFGATDCTGIFARTQLQQVLCEKTFERLEHMQQMEDLKAAGLDFLSECPFCDYRMECPPIEIDKEFRCENSKCGKTSCRLCNAETHIPLSCEEAKKDGKLTLRHVVEEAMSAALIRHCNSCKQPFVKELGCNKMTCTHCRNVQCYVCSKNVIGYDHFGSVQQKKCPLHDNIEDRHENEVKEAANEAMAKVREENPGLSDADLMIKVSDSVKLAEDARRDQAAAAAYAFPYNMVDNQLVERNLQNLRNLRNLPRAHREHPPAPRPNFQQPRQYVPPYHVAPAPLVIQPLPRFPPPQPIPLFQRVLPGLPFQHVQPGAPFQHVQPDAPFQHVQPGVPFQHVQHIPRYQHVQPVLPIQIPEPNEPQPFQPIPNFPVTPPANYVAWQQPFPQALNPEARRHMPGGRNPARAELHNARAIGADRMFDVPFFLRPIQALIQDPPPPPVDHEGDIAVPPEGAARGLVQPRPEHARFMALRTQMALVMAGRKGQREREQPEVRVEQAARQRQLENLRDLGQLEAEARLHEQERRRRRGLDDIQREQEVRLRERARVHQRGGRMRDQERMRERKLAREGMRRQ